MLPTFCERLTERLAAALAGLGLSVENNASLVAQSADLQFGDYQSNIAMILAKRERTSPRALAERIVGALSLGELGTVEIAGPGFLNFRVAREAYAERLSALFEDDRLGVAKVDAPKRVVVDFSAPNIAKPLHVGHIRSTFIGDALARMARFLGHTVVTDNHIGDWGTQFGMILYGWKKSLDTTALEKNPLGELLRLYQETNGQCKADAGVLEACKAELVKLQAGDAENLEIWKQAVALSTEELKKIYALLDVRFDHWLGESFYHDALAGVVADLEERGIAETSDGALCVFFPEDPALEDKPCLVRKADGAFLYATTDLATIGYRVKEWEAEEVWYVVGAPQQLHFQQIFAVAERLGFEGTAFRHIPHGSILGNDGKLMKTRSGENVQLTDLLEEAQQRGRVLIEEKNPTLSEAEKKEIAQTIGIGAIKYAELSQYRMTDYQFLWDKLLAFQGNTAPYLQYSYVRIQSIFRKAKEQAIPLPSSAFLKEKDLVLDQSAEQSLARLLCQYAETVPAVLVDHRPNILTNYLYDLARAFHAFFEKCPVLKANTEVEQHTRLVLCALTSKTLKHGLELLGIQTTERM